MKLTPTRTIRHSALLAIRSYRGSTGVGFILPDVETSGGKGTSAATRPL